MNKQRAFLLLSILSIFILLILTEFQKPLLIGEVEKVSDSQITKITLKDQKEEIIIFQKIVSIKRGNWVEIYGSKQNSGEIIANRIACLNC